MTGVQTCALPILSLDKKNQLWNGFKKFSLDLPVVYMLVVVCIAMGFLKSDFFSIASIISMLISYSYYIIGAIGLVFVFLSGNSGIDLSIGYVMGFSAVVATKAMSYLSETLPDMNPWLIILLGLIHRPDSAAKTARVNPSFGQRMPILFERICEIADR